MSEEQDRDSQTEEPTEKRLADAIEKGNVPFSRDAITFGSLVALLLALIQFAPQAAGDVLDLLRSLLGKSGDIRLDDREAAMRLLMAAGGLLAASILPVLALLSAGSIIASLVQNVPSAAIERITPRLSRISPLSGFGRLYGKAGMVEFSKSVAKLTFVLGFAGFALWQSGGQFLAALRTEPGSLPQIILSLAIRFVSIFCAIALLLALFDVVWSRIRWRRALRMSRHDIREEMKQADGDPHVKQRIRTIARRLASRRMLDKLPTATMVIVNPTHYAVALRYARQEAAAPVVVAKGLDYLALRIRQIAETHEIPVIENKPLARALYDSVQIDSEIPPEFYRAVAEVIHFVNSRRRPAAAARGR